MPIPPSLPITTALLLLAGGPSHAGAQGTFPLQASGVWTGLVQYRDERVLDPADLYDTRDTGNRIRAQGSRWIREYWRLQLSVVDGEMSGSLVRTAWNTRMERGPEDRFRRPVTVALGEDGTLELEWGMSGTRHDCEAEVRVEDEGQHLTGTFLCRRPSRSRDVIEIISRGELELTPETPGG